MKSFEKLVESIFDGFFSRAFKSSVTPLQIGRRLLQHIDAHREVDVDGRRVIPNTYVVNVSPEDREGFVDLEPALLQELKQAIAEYAKQEGYVLPGKIRVALHTDETTKKGRFEIDSHVDLPDEPSVTRPPLLSETPSSQRATPHTTDDKELLHRPAQLTLPTGQQIALREGHYSVGRSLDCDIVISDPNVSRVHAEFISAAGDVIIRDKGSTNGTRVNGVAVHGDQLLQHGDVVTFGTAQVRFEKS